MTRSLKRRTVYWACFGVGLILAGAGILLYTVLRAQLLEQYDATLVAKSRALITLTEFDGRSVDFDLEDELSTDFQHPDDPFLYVMWSRQDGLVGHAVGVDPEALPPLDEGWELGGRFADIRLPDGREGRMVQVNFMPRVEYEGDDQVAMDAAVQPLPSLPEWVRPRLKLVVAWQREDLDARLVDLVLVLMGGFFFLVLLVAGALWIAVTQGFKPVDQLAAWMGRIDADGLRERIDPEPEWVELRSIVDQFHRLLDRLHGAFQREKEVTSSIAHELRTPVTEMRNLAQVAERWADDPKLLAEFLPLMVDTSRRMERTIETFLSLARAEAGSLTLHPKAIILHDLVDRTFAALNGDPSDAHRTLTNHLPPGLTVRCDPDLLAGVLGNLLDNALSYSPPGAELHCDGGGDGDRVWIAVANPAPELKRADLPLLFERLWRKSGAGGEGRHRGLGLTLVKAYVSLMGLQIGADLDERGELRIRVTGLRPAAPA